MTYGNATNIYMQYSEFGCLFIDERRIMEANKPQKSFDIKKEVKDWIISILVAILIVYLLTAYVFTIVNVEGKSMLPTINNGDRIVVTRMGYEPKNGDIVVFHPDVEPNQAYIKRVIAVEGQTVYIDYRENRVLVDGEEVKEDYIFSGDNDKMENTHNFASEFGTVPKDCCFVMGDNRNESRDSRDKLVGFVSYSSIIGKAAFRIFPFNHIGQVSNTGLEAK